ncbi:unnamed protein product [Clonostachys rhizophaga]|uniref:Uncharacterized protein n=1 Tax=Clonostachys rhizophaga TaxID=160324 RepID=A0A9N9VIB3_9HYPO|nr:unnamed protein product [Clonostachys rhizophaga]
MIRFHSWGREYGDHWQGQIIDPNELVDPHSDPRSAFTPVVLDKNGEYSEPLTRGFLKERICACWNVTNIGLFFQLMQCNRTDHKAFLFRTSFTGLSIENCTILWRVAQVFSMQDATTKVGNALKKVYASSFSRNQEQSWVEDEAFRILVQGLDSTQKTTTALPTTLQTTPSTTLTRQLDATIAQHNESGIEFAVAGIREPAKGTLKFLPLKPIVDDFSSTEAKDHLAQLVTRVEKAISRRDKFIVDQLHTEDAEIDKELCRLRRKNWQDEMAEEAHHGIMKLGNYLDTLGDDGEYLPPNSRARKALNALEGEIKKLRTKRTLEYESEFATLREKKKRMKTQVALLEKTERTLSPEEVSACVKVY